MTDPDPETESRLVALEERVAHQARTIEDLSDEIARQGRESDAMKVRFERLAERFLTLEEEAREAPAITRPPHY